MSKEELLENLKKIISEKNEDVGSEMISSDELETFLLEIEDDSLIIPPLFSRKFKYGQMLSNYLDLKANMRTKLEDSIILKWQSFHKTTNAAPVEVIREPEVVEIIPDSEEDEPVEKQPEAGSLDVQTDKEIEKQPEAIIPSTDIAPPVLEGTTSVEVSASEMSTEKEIEPQNAISKGFAPEKNMPEKPAIKEPDSEKPAEKKIGAEKAVDKETVSEKIKPEKPAVKKSALKKAAAKKRSARKALVKKSPASKPSSKKIVKRKIASGKSAAKKKVPSVSTKKTGQSKKKMGTGVESLKNDFQDLTGNMNALEAKINKMLNLFDNVEVSKASGVKTSKKVLKTIAKRGVKVTDSEKVIKLIKRRKKNGINASSLSKLTGFSAQKIRKIISKAYKKGEIKRTGRGVYISS